jgi:hypothetical protein
MREMGKLILEVFGILEATFILVMIMAGGDAGGIPPVETGIALVIVIGAIMIHRLTEAISKLNLNR